MLQALRCKNLKSDSHSAIYIIVLLGIINGMVNLKQLSPIVPETNWPCTGYAMAVLGCSS